MIEVTFLSGDGGFVALEAKGHAMFADYGSDIVCSAASALIFNCLNSIEAFCGDGYVFEQDEEEGYLYVSFKERLSDGATLLLNSLALGLSGISEGYGRDRLDVYKKEV